MPIEQPEHVTTDRRLTKHLASLSGRSVAAVWRLAAVSADGRIPLPDTLVVEGDGEYVVMSYAQQGLTIAPPVPRPELRWPTELELSMARDGADEWLDLFEVEDDAVLPPLPLTVRVVDTWTVEGDYLAGAAMSISDGMAEFVITTTDAFGLVCVERATALRRLDTLAAALSMPVNHNRG